MVFATADEVELPEDVEMQIIHAALYEARRQVYFTAKGHHAAWQLRQSRRTLSLISADNLRVDVIRRGTRQQHDGAFEVRGFYADLLAVLCYYFTDDARFDESADEFGAAVSRKKGILLRGPVGCRKTSLLRLFATVGRLPFAVVSAADIVAAFRKDGQAAIDYWAGYQPGLLIDDFGAEPTEASNYGNRTSPALDVLLARADAAAAGKLPGWATHLTTNLSAAEIEARYGERAASRCRSLFNAFAFPADELDYRR